jgi:uncharacterized protein YeaO (DUF488 family)
MTIEVERAYGDPPQGRGRRFLVDRLWPRGVRRRPLQDAARRGRVVLLFGAKDEEHNNAIALDQYLEKKLR